jgi:hypothetical protein
MFTSVIASPMLLVAPLPQQPLRPPGPLLVFSPMTFRPAASAQSLLRLYSEQIGHELPASQPKPPRMNTYTKSGGGSPALVSLAQISPEAKSFRSRSYAVVRANSFGMRSYAKKWGGPVGARKSLRRERHGHQELRGACKVVRSFRTETGPLWGARKSCPVRSFRAVTKSDPQAGFLPPFLGRSVDEITQAR